MSDSAPSPRPVSPPVLVAVFAGFALFLLPLYFGYVRHRPAGYFIPESGPAELQPPSDDWQASAKGRLDYLRQLRATQEGELSSYGWIDRNRGIVRLPIDRAMDLVVADYGKKPQ